MRLTPDSCRRGLCATAVAGGSDKYVRLPRGDPGHGLMLMTINGIRKLGASAALVCALLASPAGASHSVGASTPAAYDCEGSACSAVTLTWDDEGQFFLVGNNSDSRVKVEVKTYAGDSSVHVEPHKTGQLQVKYFNGPYRADFE